MNRRPAVTVLVCTYNRLPLLKKALSSVYAQTLQDFEIVVADDGSTDGTARWLRKRRPPRLVLRHLKVNHGPSVARNVALAVARGRYIAFLDSDDLWRPDYLRCQLARVSRPGIVASMCDYDRIDGAGRVRDDWKDPPVVPREIFHRLTGQYAMPPFSTLIARRSALNAVGGFDERFKKFAEDADIFLRLGARYGRRAFAYFPEPLVGYRRHDGQMTDVITSALRTPFRGEPLELTQGDKHLIFDLLLYCRKHGL